MSQISWDVVVKPLDRLFTALLEPFADSVILTFR